MYKYNTMPEFVCSADLMLYWFARIGPCWPHVVQSAQA